MPRPARRWLQDCTRHCEVPEPAYDHPPERKRRRNRPIDSSEMSQSAGSEHADRPVDGRSVATPIESDFLPDFVLPGPKGQATSLVNKLRGKPVVVLFFPDGEKPACQQQLRAFAEQHEALAEEATLFLISRESWQDNANRLRMASLPFEFLLSDSNGDTARAYGVEHNLTPNQDFTGHGAFTSFVADANRRILRVDRGVTEPNHAGKLLDFLRSRPRPEGQVVPRPAPVLYVPNVIDEAFCRRLIEVYHAGGNVASGVQRDRNDGAGAERIDPAFKLRRDHTVSDSALNAEIKAPIGRRIVPEIAKAFFYRVTGFESFRIVCYDAETGGYFRTHRDNTTVSSAHRRFAMTLNLNAGEYQGGQLRFPEYGPDLYSPATGDAVIFSCSLLHEAMPVTAGKRYALLAFFYGADGQELLKGRPATRR